MKKTLLSLLTTFTPMALFAMQQNTPPTCKGCCGNCAGGCCSCAKIGIAIIVAIGAFVAWWFLRKK